MDQEPTLPWFFNGICVTNETYHQMPAEPIPCKTICDQQLHEYKLQQATAIPLKPSLPPPTHKPTTSSPALNEKRVVSAFISWIRGHLARHSK